MKKYLYLIFLALTLLGFSSCNSDSPDEKEIPPKPIENPKEDDLLGTWEVYYSAKQVSSGGTNLPVFRRPDYDGFINKFYKGSDGSYIFENLNLVDQVIDKGTYKIDGQSIIMDVTMHNGRDTAYQNIETIGVFLEKKETISVFKFFTIDKWNVKDNRAMRNLERAPKVHPDIEKIDMDTRFNEMLGTWEIYDYLLLNNGKYEEKHSQLELDTLKGNSFTFTIDTQGKKRVSLKLKGWDDDGNMFWDETSYRNLEVKIVDDVIYYIAPNEYNEKTEKWGPQAFWLWITEWQDRKDPDNGQTIDSFIDLNQLRTDAKPELYYQEKRYFKRVK
ncbi:MAG: hypothetical protein LBV71_14635 [Prevotella sp.]|jgi:hypothetical protein|nr:hypothetical protein [Prevotella sp.]